MTDVQKYTLEEVSKNDGKNGNRTWFVVKNNVYDVTDYMNEHPGGKELIEECAGKNATKEYNDAGHSSDANRDLKKYKIGELDTPITKQPVKKTATKAGDTESEKYTEKSCCYKITCGLCS